MKFVESQSTKEKHSSTINHPLNCIISDPIGHGFTTDVFITTCNFVNPNEVTSLVYKGNLSESDLKRCKDCIEKLYKDMYHDPIITLNLLKSFVTKTPEPSVSEGSRVQTIYEIEKSGSASSMEIANAMHVSAKNDNKDNAIVLVKFGDGIKEEVYAYCMIKFIKGWAAVRFATDEGFSRGEFWNYKTRNLKDAITRENKKLIELVSKKFQGTPRIWNSQYIYGYKLKYWDKLVSLKSKQKDILSTLI